MLLQLLSSSSSSLCRCHIVIVTIQVCLVDCEHIVVQGRRYPLYRPVVAREICGCSNRERYQVALGKVENNSFIQYVNKVHGNHRLPPPLGGGSPGEMGFSSTEASPPTFFTSRWHQHKKLNRVSERVLGGPPSLKMFHADKATRVRHVRKNHVQECIPLVTGCESLPVGCKDVDRILKDTWGLCEVNM